MKSYNEYRLSTNPQEEVMLKEFMTHFSHSDMESIVFGAIKSDLRPTERYLTEREENIVATMMQWLGSPVGQGFLVRCGFKLEDNF